MSKNSKLVGIIAGKNFTIEEHENPNVFTFTHNNCGNKFIREIRYISQYGVKCPRCDASVNNDSIKTCIDESLALQLYQRCKELLPSGSSIIGDTSDKCNTIKVVINLGNEIQVLIEDLLNNVNLPDCLLRRGDVHSVQLELIDRIMPPKYLVLDDFQSLDTLVRVKNQETLTVFNCKIEDLLREVLPIE